MGNIHSLVSTKSLWGVVRMVMCDDVQNALISDFARSGNHFAIHPSGIQIIACKVYCSIHFGRSG
jgi:hypothetical protein